MLTRRDFPTRAAYRRWRTCESKVRHRSYDQAWAEAERHNQGRAHRLGQARDYHAYLCPHCKYFHVGRRP